MVVHFELDGNELVALKGGPQFKFDEEGPCGRLKDRFGLSWQVARRA